MSQFIICNKDNKGIIAEVVGNMLKIQKRKNDFHPFVMTINGRDFDVNVSCTGCGQVHHIECIDGKLNLEGLTLREKENDNGKEQDPEGSTGPSGASGPDTNGGGEGASGATGATGPRSYIKRPAGNIIPTGATGSNPES